MVLPQTPRPGAETIDQIEIEDQYCLGQVIEVLCH